MRPVINPIYPIEDVASVEELMDVAAGMEREAAERYEQLAEWMDGRGDAEMAGLFRRMAALERDHESGIGRWAEREGRPRPLPAHFGWRMPETFDEGEMAALTPYRALGIAVRNEERAFAFYTYLSAMAGDAAIRSHAEALAREELAHVAELRKLRRTAFHMERHPPGHAARAGSVDELQALADGLAWGSTQVDAAAVAALDAAGAHDAAIVLARLGQAIPADRPGSRAAEGARAAGLLAHGAMTADGALDLALRDADEVADAYMAIAEQAEDEDVLHRAQELAEQAVGRAALLRTVIDQRQGMR